MSRQLDCILGISAREYSWTRSDCSCFEPYCQTNDASHYIYALPVTQTVSAMSCSEGGLTLCNLLELRSAPESGITVLREPCKSCGCSVECVKTIDIAGARSLVLLGLSRNDGRQKQEVDVRPDMLLNFGPTSYHLRSVVVHRGIEATSGHYVCYVRRGSDDGWWLYDDAECTPIHDTYPPEVVADGRLFLYSTESPRCILRNLRPKLCRYVVQKYWRRPCLVCEGL